MHQSVRRMPIVVVLVAAALFAVVAGNAHSPAEPAPRSPDGASEMPVSGTNSSAWFCPGVPSSISLSAQTVTISNIGSQPASTAVTVYPDDGSAPVTKPADVGAHAVVRIARADLGPAGGVVVEAFSRDVVVEFGVESSEQFALGPCASVASKRWYFAAGTTGNFQAGTSGRPVQEWLALFNPFGTDARVEVTLRTNEAVPDVLQKIDVPRRTRVLVPIHDRAVRKPRVAVAAHATVGQVVAAQTMVFGRQSGFTGITMSLGAVKTSPTWSFGYGAATRGSTTYVAVVNPGLIDTEVDVSVTAANAPVTVPVKRDAVVWVKIGGCTTPPAPDCIPVRANTAYVTTVSSDSDNPVVAEQLTFMSDESPSEGVATMMGTPAPARTGVFALGGTARSTSGVLAIANPGAAALTADVTIDRGGRAEKPAGAQRIALDPGQVKTLDLKKLLASGDGALVVTATDGVVVSRMLGAASDFSRAEAIASR